MAATSPVASKCTHCQQMVTSDITEHQLRCGMVEVKCPHTKNNAQCGSVVARRELHVHARECGMALVACDLALLGCAEKFAREDAHLHRESHAAAHSKLVGQGIGSVLTTLLNLQQQINELRRPASIKAFGGSLHSDTKPTATAIQLTLHGSRRLTSMTVPRNYAAVCRTNYDSLYYVAGGFDGKLASKVMERFDDGDGSWTTLTPMPTPRASHMIASHDNFLYCIGGATPYVDVYDIKLDQWLASSVGHMSCVRSSLCGGILDGRIYAFGGTPTGNNEDAVATAESLDVATGSWTTVAPPLTRRVQSVCVAVEDKLLVMGGIIVTIDDGKTVMTVTDSVEEYDPANNTWRSVTWRLPSSRTGFGATYHPNGTLLITGGWGTNGTKSWVLHAPFASSLWILLDAPPLPHWAAIC